MKNRHPRYFNYPECQAYHFFELVPRQLGFELLDFVPLEENMFLDGSFARHTASPDKSRIDPDYYIMTDLVRNLGIWDTLSLDKQQRIARDFDKLVKMSGDVDKDAIMEAFKDEKWVYKRWFSNPYFGDNLNKFNERKREMKANFNDYEWFLRKYYPNARAHFFNRVASWNDIWAFVQKYGKK